MLAPAYSTFAESTLWSERAGARGQRSAVLCFVVAGGTAAHMAASPTLGSGIPWHS